MIYQDVNLVLEYELENLHHVVVQASYVDSNSVYALQLLHGQTDTIVYRGSSKRKHVFFDESMPILYLDGVKSGGKAGGHTQTWINAGRENEFFVGVKPKYNGSHYWDSQIARVNLKNGSLRVHSNTELPRLSYLNRAGSGYKNNSLPYPGKELVRVEAAVSPTSQRLLIASIDKSHTGYFALYDLNEVNQKLDRAGTEDVNIQNLTCLGAFKVANFNSQLVKSVQGYALDDQNNVYISSQPGPKAGFLGRAKAGEPRQIIKMAWGEEDPDKWIAANLDQSKTIDALGYVTEFEGIQANKDGSLYLTIAYHRKSDRTTLKNRVYRLMNFN